MAISGSQKAYLYALSNIARAGASRSGYTSGLVFVGIGGVPMIPVGAGDPRTRVGVLLGSLTITDNLDEAANRCTFRVTNTVPTMGQELLLTLGSKNNDERLFAGHVVDTQQLYASVPANKQCEVSAVDYTWQLGFVLVTERYTGQSATVIAQDLITKYGAANGFTAANVEAGLPTLSELTYTNEPLPEALTRLVRRIGGYWYVDYRKDLHLFITSEVLNGAPVDLTPTHPSLDDFTQETDTTQALTRVYVEGRGSKVLTAVGLGETRIPLEAIDMFTAAPDVFAKVSFQGSEGGAQHLTYTGVVAGGGGTLVGPGVGPAAAPVATAASGAGLSTGAYLYAVTFVTAAGESLPSPTVAVSTPGSTVVTPPAVSINAKNPLLGGALLTNKWYGYVVTYTNAAGETTAGPENNPGYTGANNAFQLFQVPISPDPSVTGRKVYRSAGQNSAAAAIAGPFGLVLTIADNSTITINDTLADGSRGAAPPGTNTATVTKNQVALSAIPLGAASVTARKVYRTAVGGGQLKLQSTIANNSATTLTDATADVSLGANVPTSDTSSLTQPDGQILAAASSIIVAGVGAFESSGGWAIVGNGEQVIRYTGIGGGALTGIPATGAGALTATITYSSTITAAPMLTGIPTSGARSISRALVAGDELYLVVQVDDLAGQAQLAALIGGTGIREEWIQDRRLSIAEGRARGQATLGVRPLNARSIAYTCRDLRTASGKTITVNLPAPTSVTGAFKIQTVTISNFRPHPNQYPTFAVQASSTRFSFEDLLRVIKTKE